ncbi:MAG: glycoside hydrolase family 13 protein [Clostridiales Family XIII bacterium]|jgi:glycosidase|nr:glycoside hydrolase family 13 protein [Clostridiales Family XIII bacterium]
MNEIFVADTVVRDSSIVHESAKERYRSPLGAVPAGVDIAVGLSIHELRFERARLAVLRDGRVTEYAMEADGTDDDMLRVTFATPTRPCVLWYWFAVDLPGGHTVYYGTEAGDNSGVGQVFPGAPPAFQITVFDREFVTPDWVKSSVMYQIFPDRFRCGDIDRVKEGLAYHLGKGRSGMWLHDDWDEPPAYLPREGRPYYEPLDFFGGDLRGITAALPRLKDLGVSLLYLNPVFEAASNHRYNTADYLRIDPILGTEDDFDALIREADRLGVRVILDGVFSHTGDDSVYFNRYGRYDGVGAYQSKDSRYFGWYKFSEFPDRYDTWWGFDSLPEVDEGRRDWIDFVIENEDSVFNTWLNRGASGFRLDVADELPDDTIARMRAAMKRNDADSFLLGEVWEDATTKQSYNTARRYALGRGLDSVMNYPFAERTVAFLLGRVSASAYRRFLVSQSQNYPKEMYFSLMNLLSSHDIARVRTVLGTGVDAGSLSREEQARFILTEEQDRRGAALQRVAAAIQFALPGIPAVYYGDEVGMNGLLDPFNRLPYTIRDEEITEFYRTLMRIRNENPAMRTGDAVFFSTDGGVVGILRFQLGGRDAFGKPAADQVIFTACNPSDRSLRIVIDLWAERECLTKADEALFRSRVWLRAVGLTHTKTAHVMGGLLDIVLPPFGAEMYELIPERDGAEG